MSGIYLHIPFCKQACNYCDFYFTTSLKNKHALVTAMCKEIEGRHEYLFNKNISSIYFGGGTPSMLDEEEISLIFSELKKYFSWNDKSEITFEVNPDDISRQSLLAWQKMGINRLSIGLQSFIEDELRWMNRAHNAEESVNSVKMAQDGGFSNISIDLIYGSKFQTLQSWEMTLQKAIDLKTQHISAYNLTIEHKTVLGVKHARGTEPSINEEVSNEQFQLMIGRLTGAGFVHYEISNFGMPGYFALHNSNYWLQQPYLGLGPSAHSFNGSSRQWNVKNNQQYISALQKNENYFEKEVLSIRDRYNEYILTRLRTIWGCDLNEIRNKFGEEYAANFKNKAGLKKNKLNVSGTTYTLSNEGKSHADGIASDLFIL